MDNDKDTTRPHHDDLIIRTPEEIYWTDGENLYDWLERNAKLFLTEMASMGMAKRGVSDRVKLEALKELICRPLPTKSIYELRPRESALERLSDEDLIDYIKDKLPETSTIKDTDTSDTTPTGPTPVTIKDTKPEPTPDNTDAQDSET